MFCSVRVKTSYHSQYGGEKGGKGRRLILGKKRRKEGKTEKRQTKTKGHTERQRRNSIMSTCSPSGKVKESESSNQFQNGHIVKLQPVLSAKSGGSVQERHTGKRLLKGCNGDFYLLVLILPF